MFWIESCHLGLTETRSLQKWLPQRKLGSACCYSDQTKQIYSSPCLWDERPPFLFLFSCKQQDTTVLTAFNKSPVCWQVYNTSVFCLPSYRSVCLVHIIQVSFDARPHTGGIHDGAVTASILSVCRWRFMISFYGFAGVKVLLDTDVWKSRLMVCQQVGLSERGTSKKETSLSTSVWGEKKGFKGLIIWSTKHLSTYHFIKHVDWLHAFLLFPMAPPNFVRAQCWCFEIELWTVLGFQTATVSGRKFEDLGAAFEVP